MTKDRWIDLGARLQESRGIPIDLIGAQDHEEEQMGLCEALELHEALSPLAEVNTDAAWSELAAALAHRAQFAQGAQRQGLQRAMDHTLDIVA